MGALKAIQKNLYLYHCKKEKILQQLRNDDKIDFFIDLAANPGFEIENKTQINILTEQQIELVTEASRNIKENPGQFPHIFRNPLSLL
jgi:hypothetical protein